MTMEHWWSDADRENINTECDTYPSAILSTTNLIRTGSESNSSFCDDMPETCRKIGNEGEDHLCCPPKNKSVFTRKLKKIYINFSSKNIN